MRLPPTTVYISTCRYDFFDGFSSGTEVGISILISIQLGTCLSWVEVHDHSLACLDALSFQLENYSFKDPTAILEVEI
ncbi:uncharacterized protein LOC119370121 isoform X2 [Jatropha curcas]|uniref:uncharacterized protein LOC119370121 isoform X2 n=1 Tax=Jatropha curcas TaxID=180498 RepID=UPI001893B3C9|nr:uncharacterized protein LOC119370121 isoform X2 [Jatropha curcas]